MELTKFWAVSVLEKCTDTANPAGQFRNSCRSHMPPEMVVNSRITHI